MLAGREGAGGTGGDATGGTGGNGGDAAGGAGGVAGSTELADMWPLDDSSYWQYQVEALGIGGSCGPGTYTMMSQPGGMLGGYQSIGLSSWCSGAGSDVTPYTYGDEGNLLQYFNNDWQLALGNNIEEDAEFIAFGLTYRWSEEGEVTVPAGTFQNCWRAQQTGKVFYSIYCEDVGPVIFYFADGSGNGWDAQLIDKG